ncbi:uncharacterized protein LOC112055723 [Bicyclus anynana]|uniref:Uncharacterized protein LOC112055723 n=1 Tax=Bicyclus anynana TaxID=110368 RepID=A0A6J1NVE5_BICAN|nr:uncharacterized protein LOC112055723 [Bicyclus anynana]
MSLLLNLPDEIIILIIKMLDIKSLNNLYIACERVQNIISTFGVIKKCNLSLHVVAKPETFKLPFFKEISRHLQELNVCGMFNLYKTVFMPVVKKLHCLKTLDVTYTNISITDLVHIHDVCPTIKDVSINFSFGKPYTKLQEVVLNQSNIKQYQKMFKNFENVHFVGNLHIMLYSQLPSLILGKAMLKNIKFTIIDCDPTHSALSSPDVLCFENFTVCISSTKIQMSAACMMHHFANQHGDFQSHGCMNQMSPFDVFSFDHYESIIIIRKHCLTKPICYVTPIFEKFFSKHILHLILNIEFNITRNFDIDLSGNVCIMLWNKSLTKFDDIFFSNLWCKLRPIFPCYFDALTDIAVPNDFNLYVTIPQDTQLCPHCPTMNGKKRRTGPPICVLDFDTAFKEKSKCQLALMFENNIKCTVNLSSQTDYLRKLTYLSLSGHIRYHLDFFKILFTCCQNLVTLSVKANSCCSCHAAISRSLPLNKSIRNIQLIDRSIDFEALFSSMSQCKLLENIHILDISDNANFSSPSDVLKQCVNLYCMYLYLYASWSDRRKYTNIIKQATSSKQKDTVIKLFTNTYLLCDPYSDVFSLNLL